MKKWLIKNSEILEISEILFRVFSCPSFLMSEFSLLPYSQSRKLEKKWEKIWTKFPRFPTFSRFQSFRPKFDYLKYKAKN